MSFNWNLSNSSSKQTSKSMKNLWKRLRIISFKQSLPNSNSLLRKWKRSRKEIKWIMKKISSNYSQKIWTIILKTLKSKWMKEALKLALKTIFKAVRLCSTIYLPSSKKKKQNKKPRLLSILWNAKRLSKPINKYNSKLMSLKDHAKYLKFEKLLKIWSTFPINLSKKSIDFSPSHSKS